MLYSVETHNFPKTAKVVPLFKDRSKTDPGNYRPISLLPVIGKLFEKIIHRRIDSFLQNTVFYQIDN